jgi:hypothetical protein
LLRLIGTFPAACTASQCNNTPRTRDYYDLWRILGAYTDQLDLSDFPAFLAEKCAIRKVSFRRPEDFFQESMLTYVEKTWDQWLGPLVPGLPSFRTVITELRPQVVALLSTAA